MQKSKGYAKESKAALTHRTPKRFPLASELQGALADGFAEGLIRRDRVEPFGLRFVVVTQEVNQTQSLTPRSQLSASTAVRPGAGVTVWRVR